MCVWQWCSEEITKYISDNLPYAFCEQIGKEIRDISDEIPFEIPESWEWVRLSSICTKLVDGDHNPPKGEKSTTQYYMLSSTNINHNTLVELNKVRYLNKEIFEKENSRTKVSVGDVFFTSVGSLGRSCVFQGGHNICFQRSVTVISTLIYNYYLKYFFDNPFFQDKIVREATGTAQKGFYLNQLSECIIPLPPLFEQHRIVAKIEELLPYIERYGKAEEHLTTLNTTFPEALKKSILQEAVQGKLVPQNPDDEPASVLLERIRAEKQVLIKAGKIRKDKHESAIITRDKIPYEIIDGKERCIADEVPFEIPDSWCWCRLGTIFQHNTGKALNSSNHQGTMMQYITTSNLYWDRFELDKLKEMLFTDSEVEKCTVTKGDLLVCEGGDIGRAAIWNYDYPMRIQNHIHRLRSYAPVEVYFFYYVFYLYKRAGLIGGKGIGIQGLSSNAIDKLLIPLPPLAEQKKIVAKIEELMQYCDKL